MKVVAVKKKMQRMNQTKKVHHPIVPPRKPSLLHLKIQMKI